MEITVLPTSGSPSSSHLLPCLQNLVDQSENRIDLWNENRQVLFELARVSTDRKVKRAYDIWKSRSRESIDDPRYGDELFDALFCAHNGMKGQTPHFFYKKFWTETDGRIVYETVILRRPMCGHPRWAKIKRLTFDGRTHEFRIQHEEFGYPISVL